MPNQDTAQLQGQINELNRQIQELKSKSKVLNTEIYKDPDFYNIIRVNSLIIRYTATTAALEPSIKTNEIILWKDTTNNKFYLKANFAGTAKKIELV